MLLRLYLGLRVLRDSTSLKLEPLTLTLTPTVVQTLTLTLTLTLALTLTLGSPPQYATQGSSPARPVVFCYSHVCEPKP